MKRTLSLARGNRPGGKQGDTILDIDACTPFQKEVLLQLLACRNGISALLQMQGVPLDARRALLGPVSGDLNLARVLGPQGERIVKP